MAATDPHRASALFAKYGIALDPLFYASAPPATTTTTSSSSGPQPNAPDHPTPRKLRRVEKPIRVRIHRTCHACDAGFGPDRVCPRCGHRRCVRCSRWPALTPRDLRGEVQRARDQEAMLRALRPREPSWWREERRDEEEEQRDVPRRREVGGPLVGVADGTWPSFASAGLEIPADDEEGTQEGEAAAREDFWESLRLSRLSPSRHVRYRGSGETPAEPSTSAQPSSSRRPDQPVMTVRSRPSTGGPDHSWVREAEQSARRDSVNGSASPESRGRPEAADDENDVRDEGLQATTITGVDTGRSDTSPCRDQPRRTDSADRARHRCGKSRTPPVSAVDHPSLDDDSSQRSSSALPNGQSTHAADLPHPLRVSPLASTSSASTSSSPPGTAGSSTKSGPGNG